MKQLVLHIGLPKTGSTTLQNTLFRKHSQIYYLGKSNSFPAARGCRSDWVYQALAPAIWNHFNYRSLESSRSLLEEHVQPAMRASQTLVASWEGLGMMGNSARFAKILKRLGKLFPDLRILVTLRNPLTLAPSLYLQNLRGHFIKRNRRNHGLRAHMDLDNWLMHKKMCFKVEDLGSYGTNIRTAVDRVGKQNVGVMVFEQLQSDPVHYYTSICQFLGIDAAEGIELTREAHFNPRITGGQLELMRATEASLRGKLWWIFSQRNARRAALNAVGEQDPKQQPARVILTPAQRTWIADKSAEGHRWLESTFELDLEGYGYPL